MPMGMPGTMQRPMMPQRPQNGPMQQGLSAIANTPGAAGYMRQMQQAGMGQRPQPGPQQWGGGYGDLVARTNGPPPPGWQQHNNVQGIGVDPNSMGPGPTMTQGSYGAMGPGGGLKGFQGTGQPINPPPPGWSPEPTFNDAQSAELRRRIDAMQGPLGPGQMRGEMWTPQMQQVSNQYQKELGMHPYAPRNQQMFGGGWQGGAMQGLEGRYADVQNQIQSQMGMLPRAQILQSLTGMQGGMGGGGQWAGGGAMMSPVAGQIRNMMGGMRPQMLPRQQIMQNLTGMQQQQPNYAQRFASAWGG